MWVPVSQGSLALRLTLLNADSHSMPTTSVGRQKCAEFCNFIVLGERLNEPQFTLSTNYSFSFMINQSTPDDRLGFLLQDYLRDRNYQAAEGSLEQKLVSIQAVRPAGAILR
ncbi:hypothetical protein B0H13DRAFT_1904250 [Mycena leptocephala]|nr:hypothetical protein B0H13DRAFT_1916579 [Mycena leptocephala]KAJ7853226.1 hypothetical protein B0H13DRAFT_1904250 [Mycena leptocephala]